MVGTSLGHYRILEPLGRGGMGEVYLAEDTRLKRRVALKVLPRELASDPDRLARFRREAETVAALNHPNVVTIFSVEAEGETPFLTMELVEGRTLDQVTPADGLPMAKLFEIAVPLADALAAAHETGIVHRDLKPGNVMVSREGRVKILDFGLAKALDASEASDEATQLLTEEGKILGTVPYMAPEQVQGKSLDRRSDIFSLGVLLYEMATGKRPFMGETAADLISSILRDDPPPVTERKLELPHHLGRIIRHCLEKDPRRRYQSALDVRNELEDLRREVESGVVPTESVVIPAPAPAPEARRRRAAAIAAALAVLALLAVGVWRLRPRGDAPAAEAGTPSPPASAAAERPSIAILFFDNLSGDVELDWLRGGLTDMLVTDLSQSPDLRVLSTSRLHQILAGMNRLDERITSFDVVREVARQAAANTVILGSFAKLGDTVRVSIKIQEAATGEILEADSVDAAVGDELFARIDDLSRNIRQSIRLPAAPAAAADRDLAEVTTSSVEAYRHYVEAERLHYQSRELEAIELYEKAVAADPEFAMAWAKLATAHGNMNMADESLEYAERAMEHLDRLTEPERAYVEGRYYGRKLATFGRAIETYEATLERYPHLTSLTNNLGILYASVWLNDRAIEAFEQGIAHGDEFPGTFAALASAYLAEDRPDEALASVEEFLAEHPESFNVLTTRAQIELALGRIEAARHTIAAAEEIHPGWFPLEFGRYAMAVLERDWDGARAAIERMRAKPFPFARSIAHTLELNIAFYQGRSAEALAHIQPAIDSWGGPGVQRARVHMNAALGFYLNGEPDEALGHAEAAREEGRDDVPDYVGQFVEVLAHQALGQERRADLLLDDFAVRAEALPGTVGDFWLHEARGRLALARGDAATGVRELEAAAALLPRGDGNEPRLRYALAQAYAAAGRARAAEDEFRRIVEIDVLRAFSPVEYVRAHLELADLLAGRGDDAGAREHYRVFLDYWGGGDMDPEGVERARSFLARS